MRWPSGASLEQAGVWVMQCGQNVLGMEEGHGVHQCGCHLLMPAPES